MAEVVGLFFLAGRYEALGGAMKGCVIMPLLDGQWNYPRISIMEPMVYRRGLVIFASASKPLAWGNSGGTWVCLAGPGCPMGRLIRGWWCLGGLEKGLNSDGLFWMDDTMGFGSPLGAVDYLYTKNIAKKMPLPILRNGWFQSSFF